MAFLRHPPQHPHQQQQPPHRHPQHQTVAPSLTPPQPSSLPGTSTLYNAQNLTTSLFLSKTEFHTRSIQPDSFLHSSVSSGGTMSYNNSQVYVAPSSSTSGSHNDRYDVDVMGLSDGTFYPVHICALVSIFVSFICVLLVIMSAFKDSAKKQKPFHSWTKSERCVVYNAMCDGVFNFIHCFDHTQMLITRDHVRPIEVCELYAFFIIEFVIAKNVIVTVMAVNAYLLIRHQKWLNFGEKDWKLLVLMFGFSTPAMVLITIFDRLGPAGAFCSFRNGLTSILVTTILYTSTLVPNTLLYGAILFYVRKNTRRIQDVIGNQAQSAKGYTKAAKTMSMFVLAFLMQWSFVCIYSVWQLLGTPHVTVFFLVVIFTNLGGFFNFVLYRAIQHNNKICPRMSTNRNETNFQGGASRAGLKSGIFHVNTKAITGGENANYENNSSERLSNKGQNSSNFHVNTKARSKEDNANDENNFSERLSNKGKKSIGIKIYIQTDTTAVNSKIEIMT